MTGHSRWARVRRRLGGAPPRHAAGNAVRYEGYGPGGAAVLVDCRTADTERTAAALRQVFREHGGHLGARGSVSYLFNTVGSMTFPHGTDEPLLLQAALEAGAEDVVTGADGSIEVLADPVEFDAVRALLASRGFVPEWAEVTERASLPAPLEGERARAMLDLLRALQRLDDVQDVYSNVAIPDEVLAQL